VGGLFRDRGRTSRDRHRAHQQRRNPRAADCGERRWRRRDRPHLRQQSKGRCLCAREPSGAQDMSTAQAGPGGDSVKVSSRPHSLAIWRVRGTMPRRQAPAPRGGHQGSPCARWPGRGFAVGTESARHHYTDIHAARRRAEPLSIGSADAAEQRGGREAKSSLRAICGWLGRGVVIGRQRSSDVSGGGDDDGSTQKHLTARAECSLRIRQVSGLLRRVYSSSLTEKMNAKNTPTSQRRAFLRTLRPLRCTRVIRSRDGRR